MLPDSLKGLDMVIWETFTALGLLAEVRPVAFVGPGPSGVVVGDSFPVTMSHKRVGNDVEDKHEFLQENWIKDDGEMQKIPLDRITWLTRPSHKELQAVYITVRFNNRTQELEN